MKIFIKHMLLKLHMIWLADLFRMALRMWKYRETNKKFIRAHPEFIPAPRYIQFETTNSVDYDFFYRSGRSQASFVYDIISKHYDVNSRDHLRILGWGCGASKVLRHLPAFIGNKVELFGSDYNTRSVAYGKRSFPDFHYTTNNLLPPLSYLNDHFALVYSISVFTHLSEKN